VRSPSGDYLGRLFVFVDLTQERQLDRQRADFLTVAAHEMRTPLTPLSMYLQTLERRLQRGQPLDPETLRKARRQVGRLEKLVQDLLDVSRLEAGRVELRTGPVSLDELVGEVVDDFRGSARHHELLIQRPPSRLVVNGDRERLEQVVVNLMTNAIKYSPDGGRIEVRVYHEGDDAVVSVSDQGIGIPSEEQQRLFQRFFRARNAATSNYGGLGIGLYVSHEIVERHGGRFDVESELGKGATFSFRLPLLSQGVRTGRDKQRILLVDDDPDILEATSGFLQDEGFEVQQARDGSTALDMVRASPPDLMLLDLMMPVLDGWAFVERLRKERLAPGVPLVVFSADRDVRQKAASLNADAILRKPFSLEELHELVGRLLNGEARATAH
jgi:CheY-like chemotaxis protein